MSSKTIPISKTKLILALTSGILMGLSYMPKLGLWWCAWFALVPLFAALENLSKRNALLIGMISGTVHFFLIINWLIFTLEKYSGMQWWYQCLILFVLLCYLSSYTAIFSIIISHLCKCKKNYNLLLIAPASWVLLEFIRGIIFTGFPWGFIGYSQFKQLNIIQISDIFGVYGVSFLLVAFNSFAYIFILFLSGKKWVENVPNLKILIGNFTFILILFVSTIMYGNYRINELDYYLSNTTTKHIKVGVVQGNIDQSLKWDPAFQRTIIKKYIFLSEMLKIERPDLIIWPETATPFFFEFDIELTKTVIDAMKNTQSDFVIGSPSIQYHPDNNSKCYYNSAYLIGNNGEIIGRYDKSHLVPFGEYLPFKRLRFFLKNISIQAHDFHFGSPGKVLLWKPKCDRLGLQICYEILFPKLSRLIVNNGAELIINLTNDAWFGNTNAASQHFSVSIFRAIENRRSIVRAANTGISGFVDPVGRIISKTPIFSDKIILGNIPILSFKTTYTKVGDFFVLICGIILIISFFKSLRK